MNSILDDVKRTRLGFKPKNTHMNPIYYFVKGIRILLTIIKFKFIKTDKQKAIGSWDLWKR